MENCPPGGPPLGRQAAVTGTIPAICDSRIFWTPMARRFAALRDAEEKQWDTPLVPDFKSVNRLAICALVYALGDLEGTPTEDLTVKEVVKLPVATAPTTASAPITTAATTKTAAPVRTPTTTVVHRYKRHTPAEFGRRGVEFLKTTAAYYDKNSAEFGYITYALVPVCWAYDWLHPLLSEQDRKEIAGALLSAAYLQRVAAQRVHEVHRLAVF